MNLFLVKKNIVRSVSFLIIVFSITPGLIYSQTNQQENRTPDPTSHHEFKDDNYVPDLREIQRRSPAYNYSMKSITTTQVNVDASGQNIVGDAANEPSLAIDRNDPNRMAIGWRQFNTIASNFRQAGYGYTTVNTTDKSIDTIISEINKKKTWAEGKTLPVDYRTDRMIKSVKQFFQRGLKRI